MAMEHNRGCPGSRERCDICICTHVSETRNVPRPLIVNEYHKRTRLTAFSDRPPAISFSFCLYTSSVRGCPTGLPRVSSAALFCNTTHRLILMTVVKSQFTNSMRVFSLGEPISGKSPRTRAILCGGSYPRFSIAKALRCPLSNSNFYSIHISSFPVFLHELLLHALR
jgi:hypothetical protein